MPQDLPFDDLSNATTTSSSNNNQHNNPFNNNTAKSTGKARMGKKQKPGIFGKFMGKVGGWMGGCKWVGEVMRGWNKLKRSNYLFITHLSIHHPSINHSSTVHPFIYQLPFTYFHHLHHQHHSLPLPPPPFTSTSTKNRRRTFLTCLRTSNASSFSASCTASPQTSANSPRKGA